MSDLDIHKPSKKAISRAHINENEYNEMYAQSINENENFWRKHGEIIDWIKPYTKVRDVSYSPEKVDIKWFYDGTLNASANCLDRHLKNKKDDVAIIWEGDDPSEQRIITYKELHSEVSKFSNALNCALESNISV